MENKLDIENNINYEKRLTIDAVNFSDAERKGSGYFNFVVTPELGIFLGKDIHHSDISSEIGSVGGHVLHGTFTKLDNGKSIFWFSDEKYGIPPSILFPGSREDFGLLKLAVKNQIMDFMK